MTNQQMKILTKIRLINWHYFVDETIRINGSVLFSGENASGKSTILDAIQFVLTANASHFNPAANEKSKRDLRGYVRCKTGEEGNTYVRNSGAVISSAGGNSAAVDLYCAAVTIVASADACSCPVTHSNKLFEYHAEKRPCVI